MTLPTLDLSHFTDGNATDRKSFESELLSNLSEHGFVKLVNHGITDEAACELFEWARYFFGMNLSDKAALANEPGPDPQRGWSQVGAEKSSALYRKGFLQSQVVQELRDAREHFDHGAKDDHQYRNKWPEESVLPGFRSYMEDAFERLERTSASILEALESALELPNGSFTNRVTHENNASEMRINHYPPIDFEELRRGNVARIWPHYDLGVITLLFQDSVGGLEFENRKQKGTFDRVECGSPSEMIVNVSETLQRWTNKRLPAGLHRVDVPAHAEYADLETLPERYSIAYFCKADRDACVGALQEFVPAGTISQFRKMTAIEYHQERLLSAY